MSIARIYEAARDGRGNVSPADTARLIHARLKTEFPETGFSVRTRRSAGGASVHVTWAGGPDRESVDEVVAPYRGSRFDAAIDLGYSVEAFLTPDGRAYFAQTPGTIGSMGDHSPGKAFKPSPDAIRVRFGADYVETWRREDDP